MATLIEWLKDPANRWVEPRDVDAYASAHRESVNTPDSAGVTPLEFVAGEGQGDMANILITRYGAKRTRAAWNAFKAFIQENPDELDADARASITKLLSPRGGAKRKTRRRITRRKRSAF